MRSEDHLTAANLIMTVEEWGIVGSRHLYSALRH